MSDASLPRAEGRQQHWERVWSTRDPSGVTWYQPNLQRSLAIVDRLSLPRQRPIIDVGGGASTFVDDLLARRFEDITVLDISAAALERSRERLGPAGDAVRWVHADVTAAVLPIAHYQLWHDRAVFHFLVEPMDRAAYGKQLRSSLLPGGFLVLATFGPAGPLRCSGLPTLRYSAAALAEALPGLSLLDSELEEHVSVGGVRQQFLYAVMQAAE